MGAHVLYQGKDLGRICTNDNGTRKEVFVAEGLESLTTLFSIPQNEEVEIEFRGKMPYRTFQEKILSRISAFYPNLDEWVLKNSDARTLAELG